MEDTMKNSILVLAFISIFFSCAKEKDITGKDYIVTATARIWSTSKLKAINIDSVRFEFFATSSYSVPFATLYTGIDGTCQIVLKGDTEYWMRCTSPQYKNSEGSIYTYIPGASSFHSTFENNNKKHTYVPADFTVTFIKGEVINNGIGSTSMIYIDPINY